MPQTGVEHMGDVGHKMLGKELKSRENRQKRLKSIGKTMRQLFVYCGAYGEMDTHTLRETSCIVQHSNRFSIHLYKYNSVEFVVEWEYNIY